MIALSVLAALAALLGPLAAAPLSAPLSAQLSAPAAALAPASEDGAWRIVTIPIPDDVVLEVGGIALLADGRPIVCTRRGEVWIVAGAFDPEPTPESVRFTRFAHGLQEPLGLLVHDGWIWVTQRGELSRMRDTDGDDRVDELETVCDAWSISGNYHEYVFGPRLGPDDDLWITTNKPFGAEPFGRVKWRGFALRITPDGEMQPVACGLRSPAGIEPSPWGELFYTDNQGEWCGASKLSRLAPGSFHGHPWGIFSCTDPLWPYPAPPAPPDGMLMPKVKARIPSFELPAVWFPYDEMGRSPAGFAWDDTGGRFGPFEGQIFVVDQYAASVMRVCLEEVNGHWQGACLPFVDGLQCGATRCAWGPDGSLLVGMTNRGWAGKGHSPYGLQRVVWTGVVPFEVHAVSARSDGFHVTFTHPVDRERAAEAASYTLESYTYELHEEYGSDEMDRTSLAIRAAEVSADGRSVRLRADGLRAGYVHELRLPGVRSVAGEPLGHPRAYYTLIEIPRADGPRAGGR